MIFSIIAAVAQNGVVGNKGTMPWKNKEEMNFFKEKTTNHPVIMGRKTWDSLYTKPLKNRFNIVITKSPELLEQSSPDEGYIFVSSLEDAMDAVVGDTHEAFIIGGVSIWKYALDQDYVDRMYINVLHKEYEGDVHFPYYDQKKWTTEINKIEAESFKSYTIIKTAPV